MISEAGIQRKICYKIGILLKISHQNLPGNNIVFESYKELREISNPDDVRKEVGVPVPPEPVSLRMRG